MIHLDAVTEHQEISDWIASRVGKELTPRTFVQQLHKHLTRRHPIRIKLHESKNHGLKRGEFTIGAEYDCELDEQNKKHLIINFIINWPKTTPWKITKKIAKRFVMDMTETLVHEYQHQHQYRARYFAVNRGYKGKLLDTSDVADQLYLGQPDEIDAYAANIATRFYIMQELLPVGETPRSLDLLEYYKVFGKGHAVTKKLLKKICKNLDELQHDARIVITPKPRVR